MPKDVVILGSTGSIGTQTLEVIDKLEDYRVIGLACGKNTKLLKKQIEKYKPQYISTQEPSDIKGAFYGEEGLIELVHHGDIIVVATSGIASVRAVLEAIKNKKRIALANKETLVMAGDIVMREAKKYGAEILPIDSEHSAILQCLQNQKQYAKNLWLTASGGPFLHSNREEMSKFQAKEALNHPQWHMGSKITIDCSTLINKGLEVIEAHHLFDFSYENIKITIHPQSLIHSMVEFSDGSFMAQIGLASMHIPIQYALTYPKRQKGIKTNSFTPFGKTLEFLEPDYEKFPLLKFTIECAKLGGILPAVLNAVNEVCVYKFLRGEIGFLDIEKIVTKTVENTKNIQNPSLDEIFEADKKTREIIF